MMGLLRAGRSRLAAPSFLRHLWTEIVNRFLRHLWTEIVNRFLAATRRLRPKRPPNAVFHAPWRWWMWALAATLVFELAVFFVAQPLLADWGGQYAGSREWLLRLRAVPIFAIATTLFVIRGQPWWRYVAGMFTVIGLLMNMARNEQQSLSPLTVSFLFLLLGEIVNWGALAARLAPTQRLDEALRGQTFQRDRADDAEERLAEEIEARQKSERVCSGKDDVIAVQAAKIQRYEAALREHDIQLPVAS